MTHPAVALPFRTRVIGGQSQHRRRIAKLLGPVTQQCLSPFTGQLLALPHGIVGILHRQYRQIRLCAPAIRVVKGRQLPPQDPSRPCVAGNVVHGQQKCVVILGQLQQLPSQRQVAGQVEGSLRFLPAKLRKLSLQRLLRQLGKIHHRQLERPGFSDHLHRLVAGHHEGGAQGLMPVHDRLESPPQRLDIEGSPQAVSRGHVVGREFLLQLVEKPQPLLGEGEWQVVDAAPIDRLQGHAGKALPPVAQRFNVVGQFRDRRGFEQPAQRHLHLEHRSDPCHDLGGQERMSPQGEEVVVDARGFGHPQHLLP